MTQGLSGPTNHLKGYGRDAMLVVRFHLLNEHIHHMEDQQFILLSEMSPAVRKGLLFGGTYGRS